MPRVKEGICALYVVALKLCITMIELCFIHQKIKKTIFSGDITFIALSKLSDLLERKSTNLNNNSHI